MAIFVVLLSKYVLFDTFQRGVIMKVMWIGHGGLLFVSGKTKVVIDPYLSNSLSVLDSSLSRKLRIKRKLLRIKPNALILTSSLPEHTDWKTIKKYLNKKRKNKIAVLSCRNTYDKMVIENEPFKKKVMKKITKKQRIYRSANHTAFAPGMEWSVGDLTIRAVSAYSNDPTAFGLIIQDRTDGKKYYVAGPTMYNEKLFEELPDDLYAAFVPIGGEFGMMNNIDAVRFAKRLDSEFVVPMAYGMFNKRLKPDIDFKVAGRVLPKAYRIIEFTLCPLQPLFNSGLDIFYNEKLPKKKKGTLEEQDVDKLSSEEERSIDNDPLDKTTQVDIVKQDRDIDSLIEPQASNSKKSKKDKKKDKKLNKIAEEKAESTEAKTESAEVKTEVAEVKTESTEVKAEEAEVKTEEAEAKAESAEAKDESTDVKDEKAEEISSSKSDALSNEEKTNI